MNKSKLYIELAKTMKDLITEEMSKKGKIGMVIGEVLDPPPNLRVKIEDQIILKKNQIILAAHVNADYKRTFEIITGDDKASKLTSGKVPLPTQDAPLIPKEKEKNLFLELAGKKEVAIKPAGKIAIATIF